MNTDKLKDNCRWCFNWDFELNLCHVICKHNGYEEKDMPSKWQLHPDIAEAMQPETTELVAISFKSERYHEPVLAYFETACCNVSPIYNENFCPSCGRRIKK